MRHLTRMVDEIAGDERFFAARGNPHADMAGRMAKRGHEAYLVANAVIGADEIDKPRIPNRSDGILKDLRIVPTRFLLPIFEFAAFDQIACRGEGRLPHTIDQFGVPAHAIDMR